VLIASVVSNRRTRFAYILGMGKSCQLSEVEQQKLQQWTAAHRIPQQVALRCRIVLAAGAGDLMSPLQSGFR